MISRYFTTPNTALNITPKSFHVQLTEHGTGKTIFEQKDVLAPSFWSPNAVKIAATKYFATNKDGVRESSIFDMVERVVSTIVSMGEKQHYFVTPEEASTFHDELSYILLHQLAAFNSPVWFNFGAHGHKPQGSACYILGIEDTMESIMEKANEMATIFKYGSGAGINVSTLRSSKEYLSNGGRPSGPISFISAYDAVAGTIKSGGRTRRSALMIELNDDHADIESFIFCKATEEIRAHMLIDGADILSRFGELSGHPAVDRAILALLQQYTENRDKESLEAAKILVSLRENTLINDDVLTFVKSKNWAGFVENEAYNTVNFQNMNTSVSLSDAFMHTLALAGTDTPDTWYLLASKPTQMSDLVDEFALDEVKETLQGTLLAATNDLYIEKADGKLYRVIEETTASAIFEKICHAAWMCGDPGVQFSTTMNDWNTLKHVGRINGSNPCSEVHLPDNTSCNLASIKLSAFLNGSFNEEAFKHVVQILVIAQDMIIDECSYPTETIAENTRNFRALGLGLADVGTFLMQSCLPYDSSAGREKIASIVSLMTAHGYTTSAWLAKRLGPYAAFHADYHYTVIDKHFKAAKASGVPSDKWDELTVDTKPLRNSNISCMAPTGTISLMMDCATSGIEPAYGLVVYKSLVGGGTLKMVNDSVAIALAKLGYTEDEQSLLMNYVYEHGHIEGTGVLKDEHLPIFDCASRAAKRTIAPQGHVDMVTAIQPFISMSISKTINVPNEATAQQIGQLFIRAWKGGAKCITIYRDGCKRVQPLSVAQTQTAATDSMKDWFERLEKHGHLIGRVRQRLPITRKSITHKFEVEKHEGYLTVGLYEDGSPGEIFIRMSKQGSTVAGLMDAFATAISLGLQYGVPLDVLISKFVHTRFEPTGWTIDPRIPVAKSVLDYIFKWMAAEFLSQEEAIAYGVQFEDGPTKHTIEMIHDLDLNGHATIDAPPCPECGAIMKRSGATCMKCDVCGTSTGCG